MRSYRKAQVWIFSGDRVLLMKTNAARGWFWQPITGSIEKDESDPEGALRELDEETGIRGIALHPAHYEFEFESKWGKAHEVVFWGEVDEATQITLDPQEHCDFQWVSINEAAGLLRFESNLAGLNASLHRRKGT